MRRALALATLAALVAGAASAADGWTKYSDGGADKPSWSYNNSYTYKDKQSGRLVVMQAVSKGAMGPNAPGAADGVGSVVAIDCSKKNLISLGSYTPSKPLDIKATWRNDTPKKAEGAENEALLKAVCAHADHVPAK